MNRKGSNKQFFILALIVSIILLIGIFLTLINNLKSDDAPAETNNSQTTSEEDI